MSRPRGPRLRPHRRRPVLPPAVVQEIAEFNRIRSNYVPKRPIPWMTVALCLAIVAVIVLAYLLVRR